MASGRIITAKVEEGTEGESERLVNLPAWSLIVIAGRYENMFVQRVLRKLVFVRKLDDPYRGHALYAFMQRGTCVLKPYSRLLVFPRDKDETNARFCKRKKKRRKSEALRENFRIDIGFSRNVRKKRPRQRHEVNLIIILRGNTGVGMNIYGPDSPQFLNISIFSYVESLNPRRHHRGRHYEFMNFGSIIIIISRKHG